MDHSLNKLLQSFKSLLLFLQVDRWGLVEGSHDVDLADLKVQIASAAVFLGLSRRI